MCFVETAQQLVAFGYGKSEVQFEPTASGPGSTGFIYPVTTATSTRKGFSTNDMKRQFSPNPLLVDAATTSMPQHLG